MNRVRFPLALPPLAFSNEHSFHEKPSVVRGIIKRKTRSACPRIEESIMLSLTWERVKGSLGSYSRRDLFRRGGLLAATQALGGRLQRAPAAPLEIGANLYRSIGVRPIIN